MDVIMGGGGQSRSDHSSSEDFGRWAGHRAEGQRSILETGLGWDLAFLMS